MKKVNMTPEQYKALREYIKSQPDINFRTLICHWEANELSRVINEMTYEQVSAAYFGEQVCNIVPDLMDSQILNQLEAFKAYNNGEQVQLFFSEEIGWVDANHYYEPAFFDKNVQFRRKC
ncbi:hypothetical protein [Jeotgalibacillus haloalkalitolerans]|uniref:Uncharacterized protein n=1 Tax=Jeotgalibacillus haloalkalitolerans TaxID=3104292 RepID=A0ABU5KJF2_9BACL|nr:hypothetical protein [Jeotgalibacillus sp. HH7-29]MDZ5711348.1 hypothetical protein [Jeotgalibacillus sp. HH7-29]